ncbi:MAG: hypothetical protein ACYTBR_06250 [Planctomycetota bacterium]
MAIGGEVCLSLWTDSHQRAPAVAAGPQGQTWAVWCSHGQDGYAGAIVARRFDPGFAGGSEVLVNERWRGDETDPAVAVGPDGSVLAVWSSHDAPGPAQIRARLLAADGTAATGELTVAAARSPAVAAGSEGTFAVVYAVADESHRPVAVRVRLYDPAEGRFGDAIDVSGAEAWGPVEPAITATSRGFVVAWLEPASPSGYHAVRARRLDERGCTVGHPFGVATGDEPHSGVAVAAAPDGRFAIAFNRPDGDDLGVSAQLFAPDGSPVGERVGLTRGTKGKQAMRAAAGTRRIAFTAEGSLLCAWSGDGGFGDGSSANMTLLAPKALAAAVRGVTGEPTPGASTERSALGARPHEPPTFDPRAIEHGQREIQHGLADTGFTAIFSTGWTPPDPHVAVGPDHLVAMTNGAIAFFTKDGTLTFQDEIEGSFGFWGGLGTTDFVFDPEVLYDELSGRFFAMAAEAYVPGDRSYVLVAVSDDSDPNGAWHKYRLETTSLAGDLFDSPNIGVDAQAVYVTGDGFGLGANYPVFIYDKASLLAGNPPAVTNALTIDTSTQSAGIPPVSYDDPPALYMIEHGEDTLNPTVRLIALQDALGTPTVNTTLLAVPRYGPPEDPPQMGTSVRPETFDARFWSAVYRNGSLWATHHINEDNVIVRWYEVAMNGWPDSGSQPALVQSGQINPGPDIRTFFSAITVDDHGNAALTFARSSPLEFISMATAFRYASDPLGTFQPDVIRQTSTGPYPSGRWGDYGAVNVDPADGLTFWSHHEFAESSSWRTWIAGFTPTYHAADLDFDGKVGVNDFLLLLAAWGDCPDPCPPYCPADLDGDCQVGVTDFLFLLASWG